MNARFLRALDLARAAAIEARADKNAAIIAADVDALRKAYSRYDATFDRLIAAAHDVTAPRDRP